jgi:hypothetical protein
MTFDAVIRAKPSLEGLASMITAAYLRRQAESLIAMSRATFDLTIAGRLRRMAAELQDKATEQDKLAFTDATMALKPAARM